MKRIHRRVAVALALLMAGAAGSALAADGNLQAISKPSADVTLNFTRPGRVSELVVKEGDAVQKDQVIVKLDDREERAALAQDKAKAEDLTKIEAQKAIKAQKELEFKKLQAAGDAVSVWERDEAKLNVLVEEARLKLTDFEHEMDKLKYNQTNIAVAKMELKSPIEGVIETNHVKVGESVEPQTKVIRIVQINPLWVEVPVPYAQAVALKKGAAGTISFSDKATAEGKIVHIAAVGDAGSGTLMVRLEVPNPTGRPAGDRVSVDLPGAKVAAK